MGRLAVGRLGRAGGGGVVVGGGRTVHLLDDGAGRLDRRRRARAVRPAETPQGGGPAESHAAAKKATVIARLAHECRAFKGWDDQEPTANETSMALRLPLRHAQVEVHRSKRLHTHLPHTLGMWLDGLITRGHVRRMLSATARLGQGKCAQVEGLVLPGAETLSV